MEEYCTECGAEVQRRAGRVWGLCDEHLAEQVKAELEEQDRLPAV